MKIHTGNDNNQQQKGSISLSQLRGLTLPQQTVPAYSSPAKSHQSESPVPPTTAQTAKVMLGRIRNAFIRIDLDSKTSHRQDAGFYN